MFEKYALQNLMKVESVCTEKGLWHSLNQNKWLQSSRLAFKHSCIQQNSAEKISIEVCAGTAPHFPSIYSRNSSSVSGFVRYTAYLRYPTGKSQKGLNQIGLWGNKHYLFFLRKFTHITLRKVALVFMPSALYLETNHFIFWFQSKYAQVIIFYFFFTHFLKKCVRSCHQRNRKSKL